MIQKIQMGQGLAWQEHIQIIFTELDILEWFLTCHFKIFLNNIIWEEFKGNDGVNLVGSLLLKRDNFMCHQTG